MFKKTYLLLAGFLSLMLLAQAFDIVNQTFTSSVDIRKTESINISNSTFGAASSGQIISETEIVINPDSVFETGSSIELKIESLPDYTVTFTAGAGGTINGTSPQTISYGDSTTSVLAVPNTGYEFTGWSDGPATNPRVIDNVTSKLNLTANFALKTYTVTFTAGTGGSITGTSPQTVSHGGSSTEVTATPATGYTFSGWNDGVQTATRTVDNVTASNTYTANFTPITYTVNFTAGPNGSLTGNTSQTVNHGESTSVVTAVPDSGYLFDQWTGGSTSASLTVNNVTADQTFTASFIEDVPPAPLRAEIGEVSVDNTWKTVNFTKTYTDPVVIAGPPSFNDSEPAVVRIKNVTATSFDIRIQEWDYLDGNHAAETVHYIIVEKGIHTLADGTVLEAGAFNLSNGSYSTQSFSGTHTAAPVVITSVLTENEADAVTTRVRNIDTAGFQIKLQEQELNASSHAQESVAFIALQSGSHVIDGNEVQVGTQGGIDEVWDPVATTGFSKFIGGFQTVAGGDPGAMRMRGSVGTDLELLFEEEGSDGAEVAHANETAGYILAKTTQLIVEKGSLSVNSTSWQTVTLQNTYTNPVIVTTPAYPFGSAPAIVRLQNVTGTSFEIKLAMATNNGADSLTCPVHYFVVEEGTYTVADHGVKMEAVSYNSTVTDRKNSWTGESRTYSNTYTSPVVFGQVMTSNDTRPSVFWASGATAKDAPSASTLKTGKNVASDSIISRVNETVGYIVLESGSYTLDGLQMTAALGADIVRGMDNERDDVYTVAGATSLGSVILSTAGMDGGDGGWPVLLEPDALSGNTLKLIFDEDTWDDTERAHTTEEVAYLAFHQTTYTVTFVAGANGSITGETSQTVVEGESTSAVTAVSDTGYLFDGWDIGSSDNPLIINNVTEDLTVTANFIEDVPEPVVNIEKGTVAVEHNWVTVPLTKTFIDPVVIAGPPEYNDSNESIVRIRNVTPTSFQIRVQEWDYLDGSHASEGIDYIVVEKGIHTLLDGRVIEVGSTDLTNTGFSTVNYQSVRSSTPVILSSVMTDNDSAAVTRRMRNIGNTSFEIRLQEEEIADGSHAQETVGYIILDQGDYDLDGEVFTVGTQGGVDEVWDLVSSSGRTHFIATFQTQGGADPGAMRKRGSIGTDLEIYFEEEQSKDTEKGHANETAGFILFGSDMSTITYTVNFFSGPNGSIQGELSQEIEEGGSTSPVTALPETGYKFKQWDDTDTSNPRTVEGVNSDLNLVAEFELINNGYTGDYYALDVDTNIVVSSIEGLLANDFGSFTTVELASAAANGQINLSADGSFEYIPNAGFAGVDQFTYRFVGDTSGSSGTVILAVKRNSGANRDVYNNITGMTLAQLRQAPVFNTPDLSEVVTDFEGPVNAADNYGSRIRAVVIAPVTGKYRFYTASDDASELLFSNLPSGQGAIEVASNSSWTASREWTKYPSQESPEIDLVAGQCFYLEALSIENSGGDNLAVGWSIDGSTINVIENKYLLQSVEAPILEVSSVNIITEDTQALPTAADLAQNQNIPGFITNISPPDVPVITPSTGNIKITGPKVSDYSLVSFDLKSQTAGGSTNSIYSGSRTGDEDILSMPAPFAYRFVDKKVFVDIDSGFIPASTFFSSGINYLILDAADNDGLSSQFSLSLGTVNGQDSSMVLYDDAGPVFTVDNLDDSNGTPSVSSQFIMTGQYSDLTGLANVQIFVNGQEVTIDDAAVANGNLWIDFRSALTQLNQGEHDIEFRFTDLVGNISTDTTTINYVGNPYKWDVQLLNDGLGNDILDAQGRLQFYNILTAFTAEEVLSVKLNSNELGVNSQGIDEKALFLASTNDSPIVIDDLEGASGIDTTLPEFNSVAFEIVVKPSSFGENDAPIIFSKSIQWDNSNDPPEILSINPSLSHVYLYSQDDPNITIDNLSINYIGRSSHVNRNTVRIELADGTDISSKFEISRLQAYLKSGESFTIPVVDNKASIKIYLEESTSEPDILYHELFLAVMLDSTAPVLTQNGQLGLINDQDYSLQLVGKNLSDLTEVDVVKEEDGSVITLPITSHVFSGEDEIISINTNLSLGNYSFILNGLPQPNFLLNASTNSSGTSSGSSSSTTPFYSEDGIKITSPLMEEENSNKAYIHGRWLTVTGELDTNLRDVIVEVAGTTTNASIGKITGTHSFTAGGIYLAEGNNTVIIKANRRSNGTYEKTATCIVKVIDDSPSITTVFNFDPEEPINAYNSLYNSLTYKGTSYTQQAYQIAGTVVSEFPIVSTQFYIDGNPLHVSKFNMNTETDDDGNSVVTFALHPNNRIMIPTTAPTTFSKDKQLYEWPHILEIKTVDNRNRTKVTRQTFKIDRGNKFVVKTNANFTHNNIPAMDLNYEIFQALDEFMQDFVVYDLFKPNLATNNLDETHYGFQIVGYDQDGFPLMKLDDDQTVIRIPHDGSINNRLPFTEGYEKWASSLGQVICKNGSAQFSNFINFSGRYSDFYEGGALEQLVDNNQGTNRRIIRRTANSTNTDTNIIKYYRADRYKTTLVGVGEFEEGDYEFEEDIRLYKVNLQYTTSNNGEDVYINIEDFWDSEQDRFQSQFDTSYNYGATAIFELLDNADGIENRDQHVVINDIFEDLVFGDPGYDFWDGDLSSYSNAWIPLDALNYPTIEGAVDINVGETAIMSYTPPPQKYSLTYAGDFNPLGWSYGNSIGNMFEFTVTGEGDGDDPKTFEFTGLKPTVSPNQVPTYEPVFNNKQYSYLKIFRPIANSSETIEIPIRVKGFTLYNSEDDRLTEELYVDFNNPEFVEIRDKPEIGIERLQANQDGLSFNLYYTDLYLQRISHDLSLLAQYKVFINGEEVQTNFTNTHSVGMSPATLNTSYTFPVTESKETLLVTIIDPIGRSRTYHPSFNFYTDDSGQTNLSYEIEKDSSASTVNQYTNSQPIIILGEYDSDTPIDFTVGEDTTTITLKAFSALGRFRAEPIIMNSFAKDEFLDTSGKDIVFAHPGEVITVSSSSPSQSAAIYPIGNVFVSEESPVNQVSIPSNGINVSLKCWHEYSYLQAEHLSVRSFKNGSSFSGPSPVTLTELGTYGARGKKYQSQNILILPYEPTQTEPRVIVEEDLITVYVEHQDQLIYDETVLTVSIEDSGKPGERSESAASNSPSIDYAVKLPWMNVSASVNLHDRQLIFSVNPFAISGRSHTVAPVLTYRSGKTASLLANQWDANWQSRFIRKKDKLVFYTGTGTTYDFNLDSSMSLEVPEGFSCEAEYTEDTVILTSTDGTKSYYKLYNDDYRISIIENRFGEKLQFTDDGVIDETGRVYHFSKSSVREFKFSSAGESFYTNFTYSDNDQLQSVSSNHGAAFTLLYDNRQRLEQVNLHGEVTPQLKFIYEGNTEKISKIIREGRFEDTFTSSGMITTVVDNHGITTEYKFESTDSVLLDTVTVKGTNDLVTSYGYDNEHRLTSITSSEGVNTTYQYWRTGAPDSSDKRGWHLPKTITVKADNLRGDGGVSGNNTSDLVTNYTYSSKFFQLVNSSGPDGVLTTRHYDTVSETEKLMSIEYKKQNGSKISESFILNDFGQVTSHTSVDGLTKTFEYYPEKEGLHFSDLNVFNNSQPVLNSLAGYLYKTSYTSAGVDYEIFTPRDFYGRVTSIIQETSGSGQNQSVRTDFFYNERGELEKKVSSATKDGIEESRPYTEYSYDTRGRIEETRHFNPVFQNGAYAYIQSTSNTFYDSYGRLDYTISPVQSNQNRVDYYYKDGETRVNAVKTESGSYTHYGYDQYGRLETVVSNHDVEDLDISGSYEALLPEEATISTTDFNDDSQAVEVEAHFAGGPSNSTVYIRDGFGRAVEVFDFETGYYSQSAFNNKGQLYLSKSYSDTHKVLSSSSFTYYPGDGSLKRTTNNITGAYSESSFDEVTNRSETTTSAGDITDPLISISQHTNVGRLSDLNVAGIDYNPVTTHFGDVTSMPPTGASSIAPTRKVSSSGVPYEFNNNEISGTTRIEPSGFGVPGKVTDPANKITENTINEAGEAKASTEAKNETAQRTTHSYVNNSERISLLLRNDQLTETRYDLAGRVEQTRFYYGVTPSDLETWTRAHGDSAGAIYTSCTYDDLGRIEEKRFKDGEVHRYEYYDRTESAQKEDRLKAVYRVMPDTSLKILRRIDSYDIFGNATNVKEFRAGDPSCYSESITTYHGADTGFVGPAAFPGFGSLKSSASNICTGNAQISSTLTMNMTSDGLGRPLTKTLPSGDELGYDWDHTVLPKQLTLNSSNLISYDRTSPYKGNITDKTVLGSISLSTTYNSHSSGLVDTMSLGSEVFLDNNHEGRGLKDSVKQWNSTASNVIYDGVGRRQTFGADGKFAGDNFSHDAFENTFGDQTIDGENVRFNAGVAQNEIASMVADQQGVITRRGSPVYNTPQKWTSTLYDMTAAAATAYNATAGKGWIEDNTEQPVDLSSIALENIGPEPEVGSPEDHFLRRSYIPMAWSDGQTVEDYYWRLDLPNGFYIVEVAVGGLDDPEARDYQVDLNGAIVVNGENDPDNQEYILKRFYKINVTGGHIKIGNGPAVNDPERNIIVNKLSWVRVYSVDNTYTPPTGPKTFAFNYDSTRGRLLEDDRFSYTWDEFSRITTVTDKNYDAAQPYHPTPESVTYFYDAMGRRIAYIYDGHSDSQEWPNKRLVYDGIHLIEERHLHTGQIIAKYHYENAMSNCPLYVERDTDNNGTLDQKLVVITDDRGTVVGLTDESGNVVERAFYNSTGLIKGFDSSDQSFKNEYGNEIYRCSVPFGWTGMYKDPFTGHYHTLYRDYDPITCRWLSEDPAGYADGLNLYNAYFDVNGRDPMGDAVITKAQREQLRKLAFKRITGMNIPTIGGAMGVGTYIAGSDIGTQAYNSLVPPTRFHQSKKEYYIPDELFIHLYEGLGLGGGFNKVYQSAKLRTRFGSDDVNGLKLRERQDAFELKNYILRYQKNYNDGTSMNVSKPFAYLETQSLIGSNVPHDSVAGQSIANFNGFIYDAPAAFMSLISLTKLTLKGSKQAISYGVEKSFRGAAHVLPVGTKRNGAMFWSSEFVENMPANMLRAQHIAKQNGRMTVEMTLGGKVLNTVNPFKLVGKNGSSGLLTAKQAGGIWDIVSKRYAQGASGSVLSYVKGTSATTTPWKTYWRLERVELDKLRLQGIVTEIIDIYQ